MLKTKLLKPILRITYTFKSRIKTNTMLKSLKCQYPDYKHNSFNKFDTCSIFKDNDLSIIVINISDNNTYSYSLKIDDYFHFKTLSVVFKQRVCNEDKLNIKSSNKKDFTVKLNDIFKNITEKNIIHKKYYNLLIIKINREPNE